MLTEAELQKQWENLTFTDDFIFSRVMHDENICRQVVELILGVRIGKIHYLSAQDEHKTDPDSMRIIMPWIKDPRNSFCFFIIRHIAAN